MRALAVSDWGVAPAFADAEKPTPGPVECLVRVHSVLLGAGDVFFSQGIDYKGEGSEFVFPHIPGFRGSGVVMSDVAGAPKPGTRVAINGLVSCKECPRCAAGTENLCSNRYLLGVSSERPGCAAELVAVPGTHLHPLPEAMSFTDSLLAADAALLIHAFRRGHLALGESLAVLGAGRIGTMALAVAKAAGAHPIVALDSSEGSRAAARQAGATHVVDPTGLSAAEAASAVAHACGAPPDIVLEAVGEPDSIATAISLGRPGGRTILLGLLGGLRIRPSYYTDIIAKENELITTFGKTNEDFQTAVGLISRRQVSSDALPVRTFGWHDALDAWAESTATPGSRNAITVCPDDGV